MNEQRTSMAEEIRKRSYQVRTEEQLRDALQRFVDHAFKKPTEPLLRIPADPERDADLILADGIKELMVLRKATAADPEATITEERLKEIEERANAATPGLWRTYVNTHGRTLLMIPFRGDVTTKAGQVEEMLCMEFAADARQDVPDLLAEIKRLRAKVQEQENTIAGLREELAEPIPEF